MVAKTSFFCNGGNCSGKQDDFDATVEEYWKMVPENVFMHVCEV